MMMVELPSRAPNFTSGNCHPFILGQVFVLTKSILNENICNRSTGAETQEVDMNDTSHTIEDLKCGTAYHFFCTIRNAIGKYLNVINILLLKYFRFLIQFSCNEIYKIGINAV